MKAIRVDQFGEPDVLKLTEVPALEPQPGELVVKIGAAGVNPVDTYIRAGTYARKPALPYTPGNDGAGRIERVGGGLPSWMEPGRRVYVSGSISGTYAEEALCSIEQVHPLPDGITFAEGAALGVPYLTAHYALFARGRARPGEWVLIHGGTGGVGLACIHWARRAGLKVIATGGSEAGRALLVHAGVEAVLDHRAADYLEQVLQMTDGRGVDLVVEMLANVNLGRDLTVLAPGGRVAIVGSRGPVEINPRDAMARSADLLGVMLFNAPAEALAGIHHELQEALHSGSFRPVVGRELPLAEAAEAHRAILRPGATGKIVLHP